MKANINKLIFHPLFAGSMVMIIGNNFVNFINFVYTLLMGRLLGPSDYGTLAALLSFVGLIGMIPFSLGLVVIKSISSSKSEEEAQILISWFSRKILIFSIAVTVLVILTSKITSSFLNINNSFLIILVGLYFLFSIPAFYNRSVLQGLLRFKETVASIITENIFKLIFSIILVYLGFAVSGVVGVFVASALFGWLITRKFIKKYLTQANDPPKKLKPIFLYAVPVLIQAISATSLYSADLILVKHFFEAADAGLYAALSTLGKIVFFGASPIAAVMFPIISKKQSKGENYHKIFLYSLFLATGISLVVLVLYWLFPSLAILILFGSNYLKGSPLLVWFGLLMSLYTLTTLFTSFHLSLGQTRVVIFPAIAAVGQIIGINLFHDSLQEVVTVSIIVVSLLLLSLSVYFFYASKINFSDSSGLQARRNNSKRP